MHRIACLALGGLAIAACARESSDTKSDSVPPATPTDTANTWVVTPTEVGSVHFGWTIAQLNTALTDSVRPTYKISDECDYVHPRVFPIGMRLMVSKDTIVRLDVDSAGIKTREGAQVGDSEEETLERYRGHVAVQPHKYTGPTGHYLVVSTPGDSLHLLIFETDGKRVERFRAGRRPQVEYVEGCA